jgi:3-methyladenine DNA glycosylase AlkD
VPPGLITPLRAALAAVADPARAPKMQSYMKSAMPYHGVASPAAHAVFREVFAAYAFADAATWRADVLAIWRAARFREERYGAIALAGHKKARGFQDLDALPMYEELIVTGAWWDYVDDLASHHVGGLLAAHGAPVRKAMLAWSRGDDMWKRRTSIICQLGFGKETDLDLLYRCIGESIASKEFFLRKAIGWALRQLAKTMPDEVRAYVKKHEAELSGLSRREAMKHL